MSKTRIAILVVLVLLLAVVFAADHWARRAAAPPPGVTDLHAFLKWHPLPQRFHVLTIDGREYLVVAARRAGWLPSGPSAYVFDKSGGLLDWTADANRNPAFQRRWPIKPGGTEVTKRTVADWAEPTTKSRSPSQ